jgi:hypothetical protein
MLLIGFDAAVRAEPEPVLLRSQEAVVVEHARVGARTDQRALDREDHAAALAELVLLVLDVVAGAFVVHHDDHAVGSVRG